MKRHSQEQQHPSPRSSIREQKKDDKKTESSISFSQHRRVHSEEARNRRMNTTNQPTVSGMYAMSLSHAELQASRPLARPENFRSTSVDSPFSHPGFPYRSTVVSYSSGARTFAPNDEVYRSVVPAQPSEFGFDSVSHLQTSQADKLWEQQSVNLEKLGELGLKPPTLDSLTLDDTYESMSRPKMGFDFVPGPGQPFFQKSEQLNKREDVQTKFERIMNKQPPLAPFEVPEYVEKYTHFRMHGELRDCVLKIGGFLKRNKVDVDFDMTCCFKCVAYERCYDMKFNVNVFAVTDKGMTEPEYLVEFQRRQGDGVQFSALYQNALCDLTNRKMKARHEPPLPEIPVLKKMVISSAVNTLNQMVKSPFTEVKYEGIRALAQLTKLEENCDSMMNQGTVETLVSGLKSDAEKVTRCAATGVANLAQTNGASSIVFKSGGIEALLNLVLQSDTLEVLREAGRALHALSLKLGHNIVTQRQFFESAEKLRSTPDETAHKYGIRLVTLIEQSRSAVY